MHYKIWMCTIGHYKLSVNCLGNPLSWGSSWWSRQKKRCNCSLLSWKCWEKKEKEGTEEVMIYWSAFATFLCTLYVIIRGINRNPHTQCKRHHQDIHTKTDRCNVKLVILSWAQKTSRGGLAPGSKDKGAKNPPSTKSPVYRYLALGIQDSSQKSYCMECVNVAAVGRHKTESHMVGSAQWNDKALFSSWA